MNIQKLQAADKNVYLRAKYEGFEGNYFIKTDEQRLAQVIMCL